MAPATPRPSAPGGEAAVPRSLLDPVLAVVRELGAAGDLSEMLSIIARAATEVVGFGAAAVNVRTGDVLRVDAVVGPPGVEELLATERPVENWLTILERSEMWGPQGRLRFYGHELDQDLFDVTVSWVPDPPAQQDLGPDDWHPEDVLVAPMWDRAQELIGVISVDQPGGGRRPDPERLTVLEVLAVQAGRAIEDARARADAEARRRATESLWRVAFEHSPLGGALVEPDGLIRQANDALARLIGLPSDVLARRRLADFLHPGDGLSAEPLHADLLAGTREGYRIERGFCTEDGRELRVLLHVGGIRHEDGRLHTLVVQLDDVTERTKAERRLARQATHDWLTDLPNRASVEEALSASLAQGRPAGVLYCDVDRFKVVNDSLGHDAGDELLLVVARRLSATIPEEWLLGRVGGDEFVVVAPGVSDPVQLDRIAAELLDAVRRPIDLRGHRHTVEMSIGAAVSAPWHRHADEVLREADQAMNRAKRQGPGRVEAYDATQDHPATVDDLQLEAELRAALVSGTGAAESSQPPGGGALEPFFQPVVSVSDAAQVGVEALVRWRHPRLGLLLPESFLPLADSTGLIVPLGWAMLELAGRAAARWDRHDGRWVAVNASGRQLGRGQLPAVLRRVLTESGADPRRIHLEVTETALVQATPAALRELRQAAAMGVSISLDDFGTGYSSLSLLRDLPVSTVKIDRSFVSPITRDYRAAAIVRSVVGLCADLDIRTIAEGVETSEQLAVVRALGCEYAQGYLFGEPAPLAAGSLTAPSADPSAGPRRPASRSGAGERPRL